MADDSAFDDYISRLSELLAQLEGSGSTKSALIAEARSLLTLLRTEERVAGGAPALRKERRDRIDRYQKRLDDVTLGLSGADLSSKTGSSGATSRAAGEAMAAGTRAKHEEALSALHGIEHTLAGCVDSAAATMEELASNREKLAGIKAKAETVAAVAGEAHATTRRMQQRHTFWFLPS